MLWFLVTVYLFGAVCWFVWAFIGWWVAQEEPTPYDQAYIQRRARMVLRTPLWPFELLAMTGRAIGKLQQDVMED